MLAWQGQGSYGAVYRAVRTGLEHLGPGALKLSLYPEDRRFAREAQLLSRLSHPSVPRLLDRGVLLHPSGFEYPFFVMEWIDGMPLYAWAQEHAPSVPEICRVLAQLARALEALHAAGAVHRDVKGDNVLVRLSDRLPVLIDFGSGHFQGASRLTWQSLPPGTLAYLSPQAGLFHIRLVRQPDSYYTPSAADDLYALGVTAFRLLLGQYPPDMDVRQDDEGSWLVTSPDPRPLLEQNPRLPPLLREVLLRLLSQAPEARGTAALAALALEAAADQRVPERLAQPPPATELPPPHAPTPASRSVRPARVSPPPRTRAWKPWLALAAAAVCAVLLCNVPQSPVPPGRVSSSTPPSTASQLPKPGTAAVGDSSPTGPQASTPPTPKKPPLAQEPLPELRPGQLRPGKNGQCPGRMQVPINGGCWFEVLQMSAEQCVENGSVLFKGKCYAPALAPPQKPLPTSSPAQKR